MNDIFAGDDVISLATGEQGTFTGYGDDENLLIDVAGEIVSFNAGHAVPTRVLSAEAIATAKANAVNA